jgi:uncharacterized protein (TIGR02588 family)
MATESNETGRPRLEWIIGGLSAAIVAGIIVYLGYEALFGDTRPPDLAATIISVEPVPDGTLVVVDVTNRGDQAAAEVTVKATLDGPDAGSLEKQIRFDYVPSHARRSGAFIIEGQAGKTGDVNIRIDSYVEP